MTPSLHALAAGPVEVEAEVAVGDDLVAACAVPSTPPT